MRRIDIVKTFKHGGQIFHAGEVRMVSESDAGYFCGVGWASDPSGELSPASAAAPAEVTLTVQNGTIGQSASAPGVK